MGSIICLGVTTFIYFRTGATTNSILLLAAFIIYLFGVFGVTIFGNVPLNNRLDTFDIAAASTNELFKMRTLFEKPWNTLHSIRTVFSILAFLLSVLSLRSK